MNNIKQVKNIASRGRYGDSTLVHMNPTELSGLAQMGQMTVNPETGLPEAFGLRDAIPIAASIVGGVFGGPLGAGLGSGLATGLLEGEERFISWFNFIWIWFYFPRRRCCC